MSGQLERRELVLAAYLISLGIGAWLHWSITDPSFDQTDAQSEWAHVLAFSALVLALAGGAAALGRALSGARPVRCLTMTLIAAGALAAVTNIIEDGLGVEQAFVVFVLLTGVQLLALIGLATALGLMVRGARRLLALAPLASAIGVVTYLRAGGPILLSTWCAAAVYLLIITTQSAVGPPGQQA